MSDPIASITGRAQTDEQTSIELALVFEMNGRQGVRAYARHHGLDYNHCRRLLEADIAPTSRGVRRAADRER